MRPSRPHPTPAPPGEAPFGPLTLLERIAVGGMAEVFRAREPRGAGEPRTVVVKRMLPHIAGEPGAARMFEAEARIGRLVAHPNVVAVLAFGEISGQPYLTLELVPGIDLGRLRAWLARERSRLETPLALHVGAELLAGLHAVHEAKDEHGHRLEIVHGDVSPSNVLLSTKGEVKLADFGIAQARLRASFPQAASSRTRGKLAYLAPEQVRGEETDRRADVFAAAAVVAELLVGEPLFSRDSDLSTLLAIRDASLERLEPHRGRLPPALVDALERGLARDPEDRVETAAALALALRGLVTGDRAALRERLGALVSRASAALEQARTPAPWRT
ncbi:MAG: serine/threonine protein kinase [Sandaracinaceae bacterium]|nr:serine/threonine protein kinase [Sandaracinaceae bacterium]